MQLTFYRAIFGLVLFFTFTSPALFSQNILLEPDSSLRKRAAPKQKTEVGQILFTGVPFQNPAKKELWYIPAAFDLIQFNTIEGWVVNPSVSYTKYLDENKFYNLKPTIRYGIGNQRPQVKLTAQYFYNPKKFASLKLSGGRFVEQLNRASSLRAFGNSYTTTINKRNFLKIYERTYVEATHTFAPLKDIVLTNTVNWEDRSALQNLDRFNEADSEFTSNDPVNSELASTAFDRHQAFLWQVQVKWQLNHRYQRYRGKFVSKSNHPAISLSLLSAFPNVFGADVSYQKLSLNVSNHYQVGGLGKGQFLVEAGGFLSADSLSFIDFNHFNGNRFALTSFNLGDFQLLDYYQYSTSDLYLQAHIQHKINAFSLGEKLANIQPVVSLNYLHTSSVDYFELGAGIQKIFKIWRLEFYSSFRNGRHERVGLRFGRLINI